MMPNFLKIFAQLGFTMSNWQKVQLNTDLLQRRSQVFKQNAKAWLKLNEIKAIKIKLKVILNWGKVLIYKRLERHSSLEFLGLSPKII